MTDKRADLSEPIDLPRAEADWSRHDRRKPQQHPNPACDLAIKVFRFSREAILITNEQSIILSVNHAFTETTGYTAEEAIGKNSAFLFSNDEDVLSTSWIREKILAQGHWQGETWGRRKNGEVFPQWLTVSTVAGENGKVTHFINQFIDITEKKREEARFEYLAYHDPLTALPNRILFNERLSGAIALAQRHGHSLGVLFIDLDGFKQVNDSMGHGTGDLLLQQVAKRLTQCVRESDAVARLGGDEFVVLLNELSSEHSAEGVADKILDLLHTPFVLADQRIDVSVSIGIALFPDHGIDGTALLEKADAAMYQVKSRSKNNFKMFDGAATPWIG